MNINRLLVKRLQISTKQSIEFIDKKLVFIDGILALQKQLVTKTNKVVCNSITVQDLPHYFYLAYNKPRGIESTQNKAIVNNMANEINLIENYFPLGRLDKESEGLMILTNDGSIYKHVTSAKIEKEYIVEVNHVLTNEALSKLSMGVVILGTTTKPAITERINETSFKIILRQGLNRQIRRMCYKLGYHVITLKRIRIGNVLLANLNANEKRVIAKSDI